MNIEQKILAIRAAAEQAGLLPNTVEHWLPALMRYTELMQAPAAIKAQQQELLLLEAGAVIGWIDTLSTPGTPDPTPQQALAMAARIEKLRADIAQATGAA